MRIISKSHKNPFWCLHNPFFLLLIVTFLRLWSARSSSSSCCAASLASAKEPMALLYNTSSPRLSGWPLRLGVPLPLWNSKDKKCCLYKTPYIAAPTRVLGDIIAKTTPYNQIPLDAPTRTRIFLGSRVMRFWEDPSHHIETCMCIFCKEVYKQKWYQKRLLIVLQEFRNKYLQVSHQGYSALTWHHEHDPQEPWWSRWPWEKDAEQSAVTHTCHTQCASSQLGTTANRRYDFPQDWLWDTCQLARVRWGTCCKGFHSKEGPHYCIEWSGRNPFERNQVQRIAWEIVQRLS